MMIWREMTMQGLLDVVCEWSWCLKCAQYGVQCSFDRTKEQIPCQQRYDYVQRLRAQTKILVGVHVNMEMHKVDSLIEQV